ncbi:MAG: hypothetical protein ACOYOT_05460 [Bacteroidales bacterium]
MTKFVLRIFTVLVFFSSCNKVGGTWKDNNIDPKIKAEIYELNNQIIDGFTEGNQEKIFSICSEKCLEQSKNGLVVLIQQSKNKFSKNKFTLLNEFYQINSSANMHTNVISGISGEHDYVIGFNALNSESYISVGYFKDDLWESSVVFIYGKYGNKWKLNIMQLGVMRIMNKDAYDWYSLSKNDYEKGYFIDAINDLTLANQIMKPANQIWQYQKEKEIKDFEQKVMKEINSKYPLPMTVAYVKSKPQIFGIFPQGMEEGYFPTIQYTTILNINDSIELSKECDEIHNKIGELFKGIDKNKKMIFYRAFKSIPNGTTPIENFGFIRRYK